ncbi:hypothetical protein [Leptolyngbya sp. FACHB-17]|uniref:hypothetical protein n=1 Tax=unclassified Leptolyngbya TaxID=2650499 RepID=UPI00168175FF|nr:hypothetical protein [Leptolyngbya sp. FACHB-17]MBD2081245.1 hypothetical protein [Leptolyngbya sp. FACHB-17]
MTGFIRGLFSKSKSNETEAPVERPKKEKAERLKKESAAFFLEATEAQTFGNSEYMKASKRIRRTFPKTVDSPDEKEYIQELSAMGRVTPGKAKVEIVDPKQEAKSSPTAPIEDAAAQRRKAASDMDMFRKMAKDIRK